jgi:sulfite exporter TauE/SafE
MITLALAVLFASFLGSLHCVGMCGPFAVWATHGGSARTAIVAYHFGRLTTYLSAGLVAGVVGSMVELGGDLAGYQSLAAKLAGGLLIFFGIARLLTLMPWFRGDSFRGDSFRGASIQGGASTPKPSTVAALLQRLKPFVAGYGPRARAYVTGLLTTWLPCGWLYLFVLIAAGTGDVLQAFGVMGAFWLGTLPALTALALGARQLIPRLQSSLPIIAGVLLIVTGFYTATGRASADLSRMVTPTVEWNDSTDALIHLVDQPLPCCEP